MGAVIQNGNFVGGLDAAVAAKIGDATLTTTASDLSGAVNELDAELGNEALPDPSKTVKGNINSLKQSLSDLKLYTLIEDTTTASGAIALPTAVANGAIIDMYYEGAGVSGMINRRDKNYLTCYDNNLNIKANTPVKIHCYYTPISQS